MTNPLRLDQMKIEWEAEKRFVQREISRLKNQLSDVNYRLKVFFPGEGER